MSDNTCKECPFKRTSLPGYLGKASHDPELFLAPHWRGDLRLPCHMKVDWEAENAQALARVAPLCHGFLILCKNAAKLPYNSEIKNAVEATEPDRENFFAWAHEFVDHHGGRDE